MRSVTALRRLIPPLAAAATATLAGWPAPATAGAAVRSARPGSGLAISPQPGTPDASPRTQISILGAPRRQIRSVRVTGSLSGAHGGALRAYTGNRGASFVLRTPLTQGERVTVAIRVTGHRPISFAFTVARLAPVPPILNAATAQLAKLQRFVSQPLLLPPRIGVDRAGPARSGDLFLTPLPSPMVRPGSTTAISINPVGPGGPMIIDPRGRLVWFHQLAPPLVATNFRTQTFAGRRVLTWWQGRVTIAAFGLGTGMIYDTAYRPLRVVRAGNGYAADLHEFGVTPSGDALLAVQSLILRHNPGTAPGTLSPFIDSIVQEVDVRTGLVVWEWHALGHIPVADSYVTEATSPYYDAYHVNSIELLPGGRVLISARDTSAVYEVDRATGRVLWTLGGLASSFRFKPGARFYFQHDATLLSGHRVSLFDDEGGPPFFARSRGLILRLDLRHRTAAVARQYRRPGHDTFADSEGSVQTLAGGGALVGFGSAPYFSEFGPGGGLRFDAHLPVDDGSYRVFGTPWTATPTTRPSVAVQRISPTRVAVYASWNGATTVARWQVLAGTGRATLRPVTSARNRGFETRIGVATRATMFAVRAVSARGRVLAQSRPTGAS